MWTDPSNGERQVNHKQHQDVSDSGTRKKPKWTSIIDDFFTCFWNQIFVRFRKVNSLVDSSISVLASYNVLFCCGWLCCCLLLHRNRRIFEIEVHLDSVKIYDDFVLRAILELAKNLRIFHEFWVSRFISFPCWIVMFNKSRVERGLSCMTEWWYYLLPGNNKYRK